MTKRSGGSNVPWTEEERNFAIKNIGPMSASQVGKKIGKSADAVRHFIKRYDDERLCR